MAARAENGWGMVLALIGSLRDVGGVYAGVSTRLGLFDRPICWSVRGCAEGSYTCWILGTAKAGESLWRLGLVEASGNGGGGMTSRDQ